MDFSLLNKLSESRILVVGDVMLDKYWHGDTGRISPEAPVPVVKVNSIEDKAGGAANVAKNIAHLDGQVGLLGLVGEDEFGQTLVDILSHHRIKAELITQPELPTIAKMRVISRQQQVVRLDLEEKFSRDHSEMVYDRLKAILPDYDVVVFSDYNKGTLNLIKSMIQVAKDAQKVVLVDPKSSDFSLYEHADFVTPNLAEFALAGGDASSEQNIALTTRKLLNQHNIKNILLTRSEKGMSLISNDYKHDFPAQQLEVADVTGAGDTVIATLAAMLAAGVPVKDAVELANIAAGIVVAKLGAATVSPEELAHKLNQYLLENQGRHYQAPCDQAIQHIQFARQKGETIVFTNGCFDILHAGHVQYLLQAKSLGDRLVVGLNADTSVARLKGDSRPINSYQDRATVLAALGCVDWVIPFGDKAEEQDTPLQLIQRVNPDILVKGGDYQVASIVGADHVIAQGGQVKVLNFVEGRSTTNIIDKAKLS